MAIPQRLIFVLTLFVALLLAACASGPPSLVRTPAGQSDNYEIVDCELAGQVIRIGTGYATTGRARALRTSADDCAIRGGYFAVADQAKYQTALKVWLPLAEQGDLQAQLYLGQIYEKGLGQAPDPQAALRWYQRAAERGFAPAQNALAMLYENGLATGKPEGKLALDWYRKAAGFNEGLRYESDVTKRDAEIKNLTIELQKTREKAETLREQLRNKNIELDAEVRQLQQQLQSAIAARDQALQQRTEQALSGAETALQENQQAIAQTSAELNRANQASAALNGNSGTAADTTAPKIELLEPRSLAMRGLLAVPVQASKVRVSAKIISTQKITLVTINGTPMQMGSDAIVRADINASQATTLVEIIAKDDQGLIGKLPFVLTQANLMPPPQTFAANTRSLGKYHALVIGNDQYQFWDQLQTPRADAQAVAEVLKSRYGFQVTLLLNAKRADIFKALAKYRNSLGEDDNLLVYYSGHGSWDSANQQGYWIPVDGQKDDLSNYISSSDITDQISVMAARQVLVVADACYSGVLVRSVAEQALPNNASRDQNLLSLAQLKSRKVISSGNIRQVMDGGAGNHSIFAKQFLDSLSRRDQAFAARELYEEIAPRVADAAAGFGEQQEPQYGQLRLAGHIGGDFIFPLAAR